MSAVPVHQALFWPGNAPVSRSGEVDYEALAKGLALSEYWAPLHGRFPAFRTRDRFGPRAVRRHAAVRQLRQNYSRAQHAVVASRAVETLATLDVTRRRAIAMHAWLAELRDDELSEAPEGGAAGGKNRLALRFMEMEALAGVLARTVRWPHPPGQACADASRANAAGANPPGATLSGLTVADAVDVDDLLAYLAGLDAGDRNRLGLHALFSELLPSGLGPMAADAVLRAAGLDGEVPEAWVEILRLIRRMADETARRDVRSGAPIERTGFPALDMKIEPLGEDAAARSWLERRRVLIEAKGR